MVTEAEDISIKLGEITGNMDAQIKWEHHLDLIGSNKIIPGTGDEKRKTYNIS